MIAALRELILELRQLILINTNNKIDGENRHSLPLRNETAMLLLIWFDFIKIRH